VTGECFPHWFWPQMPLIGPRILRRSSISAI
jgi:hypothetical protein